MLPESASDSATILAGQAPASTRTDPSVLRPNVAFNERTNLDERASRAAVRRAAGIRPVTPRALHRSTSNLARRTVRAAERSAAREAVILRKAAQRRVAELRRVTKLREVAELRQVAQLRRAGERKVRQIHRIRALVTHRRAIVTKRAPDKRAQRVQRLGNGMTAVIAFARSQVGKSYVSGGEGPYGFDCSGFTKRAYARAGISLPHSSGQQAARARTISRSQARPGDLVIGPGHVGIYMGSGMMIDAGNHRTGVVYRKLYSGLRVARVQ